MNRKPLAITCGDPAGVGPELITKWLRSHPEEAKGIVPIGPAEWIEQLGINGIVVGANDFSITAGKPTPEGHRLALAAMEAAAKGASEGRFGGVISGPINKKGFSEVGYPFPGQTEFFAARWTGEPVMAFAGGRMTVGLVTWHLPLRSVASAITPAAVRRTILALIDLRKKMGDNHPRIAVCGLNPHAGEGGLLGTEDDDIIRPVIKQLGAEGNKVSGPLPGDTVFHRHLEGEFDAVVAMYHDQGLAPLKTVDFASAANLTLGLPFIRTSPDHGTAYEIAGRDLADAGSLASAIRLAQVLSA